MLQVRVQSVIAFICLSTLTGCIRRKPLNLTTAKERVEQYYECGKFDAEMNEVVNKSIKKFSKIPVTDTSVVVFDIDDTVLSDYCDEKSIQFGYVPKLSHEWILRADAQAIPQTKRLYDYLVSRGFHIIFLTGRNHDEYQATMANLKREGYTTFDKLIVRPPEEKSLTAQAYKSKHRKQLAVEGYTIVSSIGDQWSDLCGGHSGYQVKIPNHKYIIY